MYVCYWCYYSINIYFNITMKKSKGLGDDIKKFTDKTGLSKLVKTIFGDDCGCEERQQKLNNMFPNFKNIRPFTKDNLKKVYEKSCDI